MLRAAPPSPLVARFRRRATARIRAWATRYAAAAAAPPDAARRDTRIEYLSLITRGSAPQVFELVVTFASHIRSPPGLPCLPTSTARSHRAAARPNRRRARRDVRGASGTECSHGASPSQPMAVMTSAALKLQVSFLSACRRAGRAGSPAGPSSSSSSAFRMGLSRFMLAPRAYFLDVALTPL